ILLSVSNSLESKLLLPAKNRLEIDRQSLNRLVEEYADFKYFISLLKG
ncbi:HrgA protein, partial [Vibrio anguillarum]|nr:HrgA protein [Vibrio anguillarum]